MSRRLLLVDDDDALRTALAEVLRDELWEVTAVRNGQEALDELRSERAHPCAVLLDLMMPVLDGFEFRHHQLNDPTLATIPVVVLTAGTIDERVRRLGVKACMRKPIDLDTLFATLSQMC